MPALGRGAIDRGGLPSIDRGRAEAARGLQRLAGADGDRRLRRPDCRARWIGPAAGRFGLQPAPWARAGLAALPARAGSGGPLLAVCRGDDAVAQNDAEARPTGNWHGLPIRCVLARRVASTDRPSCRLLAFRGPAVAP